MPTLKYRYPLFPVIAFVAASLSGCSLNYEAQAEEMVERQMEVMVFVEGGEFMMGNPGGWDTSRDSWPPHKVVLDGFHIQKYEVTQGDFELFMAVTGYQSSDNSYEEMRDERPKRFVEEFPAVASWVDADAFCRWLGEQSDKPVQLPTEAQWEYAARARGQMLRYATANGEAIPDETMAAGPTPHASGGRPYDKMLPRKPGSFPPNPLGLYDMSGNVREWVNDYYRKDYYENSPVNNPAGPASGREGLSGEGHDHRVLRGGGYRDFILNTTVTRLGGSQLNAGELRGFRCVYGTL